MNPEQIRLGEDARREKNWKRWGPYLSERQWGTVREDYSATGECWTYFPHDHARSRAYRWGEDGLLGISDREGRLCFAVALWNEKDSILKERMFGLAGPEGNHGEDVKECYFFVDSTPTHSYMKAIYKYPQRAFPYAGLVSENRRRGNREPEYELLDTGVFADNRYFDVTVEYAKAGVNDILIRVTVDNRGPDTAPIHVLPTVWFRNVWSWGREGEGYWPKPVIRMENAGTVVCDHDSLGRFGLEALSEPDDWLFTDNETNFERLFQTENPSPHVKDAFHRYLIANEHGAVNPAKTGTKAAAYYRTDIAPGGSAQFRLRLTAAPEHREIDFDQVFQQRLHEANLFYGMDSTAAPEMRISRQASAGLLWSKQFYYYSVKQWKDGDPSMPKPPRSRRHGRNDNWDHLYNRDVISMPDTWEFPWYASWDLAFHCVALAEVDPEFAKEQLILLLREWYMHPSGQIPAYEFAFGDVNPPVHAWAAWRVYKISAPFGSRDTAFLEKIFQKLLLNFTWWVNRKDVEGKQIFSGGFLGLDNIGVFDRSAPMPGGGVLEQADGSAWMALYCTTMLAIALELARDKPVYEDIASKFFEHFVAIADTMNTLGGHGLWNDDDGFYYDQLYFRGDTMPLKLRTMVGVIPLFAVTVLEQDTLDRLPGFRKRMDWFLENRKDLYEHISMMEASTMGSHHHRLLAIPTKDRLIRVLARVLDETEFLSPYGVRSLSAAYRDQPYVLQIGGDERRVDYDPGESTSGIFGGNSNWRGPIWFPLNYLLLESLERYQHFYGDDLKLEYPTRSGRYLTLGEISRELNERLCRIFLPDQDGRAAWQGRDSDQFQDENWRGLTWFNEYFHGDTGRGCGASHQTGWTALVARCLRDWMSRND